MYQVLARDESWGEAVAVAEPVDLITLADAKGHISLMIDEDMRSLAAANCKPAVHLIGQPRWPSGAIECYVMEWLEGDFCGAVVYFIQKVGA